MPHTQTHTLGALLINDILPAEYKLKPGEVLDKKSMKTLLVRIAREHSELYPDIVLAMKKMGDTFATVEPYSPGLDDLVTPSGAKSFLNHIDSLVRREPNHDKKQAILAQAQSDATDHAMTTTGNLTKHVKSGSRGNPSQLMRMIF